MARERREDKAIDKHDEHGDLSAEEVNRTVDKYLEAKRSSLQTATDQVPASLRTLPTWPPPSSIDIAKVSQVRAALPHILPKTAVMALQGVDEDPERAICWLKQGTPGHWNDFLSPYGFEEGRNLPFPMPAKEDGLVMKSRNAVEGLDVAMEKQKTRSDEAIKTLKEMHGEHGETDNS